MSTTFFQGDVIVDLRQFLEAQKQVLEELFGTEWFSSPRSKRHPAYQRWILCDELLTRGAPLTLRDDQHRLRRITQLVLDNYTLLQATGGTPSSFRLGSLANYGDELVRRRLTSVIEEPAQFLDVLVELNYAAWHDSQGHRVRAFASTGFPDFEVSTDDLPLSLAADCKRVRASATDRRFPKLVNKANQQIKNLGRPCYGLAVIDVSEKVANPESHSGEMPQEVTGICAILERSLRQHCTSVSGVLVTWRDSMLVPMTDGGGGVLCFVRQHSHLLRHEAPKHSLPGRQDLLMVGYTAMLKVLPL
jgi:hypothetical protein